MTRTRKVKSAARINLSIEPLELRCQLDATWVTPGWTQAADASSTVLGISDDGRFTFFKSAASNLVEGDTNGTTDIFRFDREVGRVERLPADLSNNGNVQLFGRHPISGDGQVVLVAVEKTEEIFGEVAQRSNLYQYDFRSQQSRLITNRVAAYLPFDLSDSFSADMSNDGSVVAFSASANNLVANDTNAKSDVFVWRSSTGKVDLVTRSSQGTAQANGGSGEVSLSSEGQFVVFASAATNLMNANYAAATNLFRLNLVTRNVELISRHASDRNPFNADTGTFVVSNSGNLIYLETSATNLPSVNKTGKYIWNASTQELKPLPSNVVEVQFSADEQKVMVRRQQIRDDPSSLELIALNNLSSTSIFIANRFTEVIDFQASEDFRYVSYTTFFSFVDSYCTSQLIDRSMPASPVLQSTSNCAPTAVAKNAPFWAYSASLPPTGLKESVPLTVMDGERSSMVSVPQTYVVNVTTLAPQLASIDATPGPWPTRSELPSVSADNRYVYFSTVTPTLAVPDNSVLGPARYDLLTGKVERLNIPGGVTTPTNAVSAVVNHYTTSEDGRWSVFASASSEFYPEDRNGTLDVFLQDMVTNEIKLISKNAFVPRTGNAASFNPHISANGRRVIFESDASNLVPTDTNRHRDIFAYDVGTDTLTLITKSLSGNDSANADSGDLAISRDGSRIFFTSSASNLTADVPATNQQATNLFFHQNGKTTFISQAYIPFFPWESSVSYHLSPSGRFLMTGRTMTEFDSLGIRRQTNLDVGIDGGSAFSDDESIFVGSVQNNSIPLTYNGFPPTYNDFYAIPRSDFSDDTIFRNGDNLDSGSQTNDVDLADLNFDGYLDAFFTNDSQDGHRVFFGNPQGKFVDSGQRLRGAPAFYSELGDLDGDGDVDVFMPTLGADVVWLNDGLGNFRDSGQRLGSDRSIDAALGDFDRDGDLDAYVANFEAQPDRVWINDGKGRFFDSGQLLGNTWSKGVEAGDVDGDGDLDLMVANGPPASGEPNYVWLNDGAGRFTDSGQRLGNSVSQHATLGDIDGDGDLDAVFANSRNYAEANEVWINNGHGVFTDSMQRLGNDATSHVQLVDLDGDFDLDLFAANWTNQPSNVWINRGDGHFEKSNDSLGLFSGSHVALGDFDRDEDMDAILANVDGSAEVFVNASKLWDADPAENALTYDSSLGVYTGLRVATELPQGVTVVYSLLDSLEGRFGIDPLSGVVTRQRPDLNGPVQQIRVAAQRSDGTKLIRSFNIPIKSPNHLPTANPDHGYLASAGEILRVPIEQSVLLNDTDPDGDRLQAFLGGPHQVSIFGATVVMFPDGTFTYDASTSVYLRGLSEGQIGGDMFTYVPFDGHDCNGCGRYGLPAFTQVNLGVLGVNDPPQANDDAISLSKSSALTEITANVLSNDTDPDVLPPEPLSILSVDTSSTKGIVDFREGRLRYRPGPFFAGLTLGQTETDYFTYVTTDPHGATSIARVSIEVVGETESGDFNSDGLFNALDINAMCMAVHTVNASTRFDLDQSGTVDDVDHGIYLHTYLHVGFGDTNLDGIFDSTDLILAFQGGQYEDGLPINSTWETGDWNCDREFDSSDLVRAFQTSVYIL